VHYPSIFDVIELPTLPCTTGAGHRIDSPLNKQILITSEQRSTRGIRYGSEPPRRDLGVAGHKVRVCGKNFQDVCQMADLCVSSSGANADSRSGPDTSPSAVAVGVVRGSGKSSARPCEYLTLPAAVRCVLAHNDVSAAMQAAVCHQVHDRWRYRCTQWTKNHPEIKLPEVTQSTRGNRRKVMRVLPISDAMAIARRLVKDGLEEMTQEITKLTDSLNLQESGHDEDDSDVEEE